MIRPLPSSIGFHYRLVPVFTWQKLSTTEDPTPDSNTAQATSTQASQSSAPVNTSTTEQPADMRLVFSGYRWRVVAHFEQTPNRGYERFTETDPGDSVERARARAIERQQIQAAQDDAAVERQASTAMVNHKPASDK